MEIVMAPAAKAPRRYFVELTAALALYFGAIALRQHVAPTIVDPVLKAVVVASPVLPVLLMAAAILRFFYKVDEYRRRQILESFALAGAATCVLSVCWMFLDDLGLPQLSLYWTWPIQAGFWVVILMVFKLRDRASEGAAGKTVIAGLANIGAIAALAGLYGMIARHTGWPDDWLALSLVAVGLLLVRVGFFVFLKKNAC
jgi:hypothetical protein